MDICPEISKIITYPKFVRLIISIRLSSGTEPESNNNNKKYFVVLILLLNLSLPAGLFLLLALDAQNYTNNNKPHYLISHRIHML